MCVFSVCSRINKETSDLVGYYPRIIVWVLGINKEKSDLVVIQELMCRYLERKMLK